MTVNDTDKFLVNRSSSSYYVEQKNLMATLQDTDLLLVNRSNVSYKITGAELKESVIPPVEIVQPTIIAPPDGAGVGGDVTYTPKTSPIIDVGNEGLPASDFTNGTETAASFTADGVNNVFDGDIATRLTLTTNSGAANTTRYTYAFPPTGRITGVIEVYFDVRNATAFPNFSIVIGGRTGNPSIAAGTQTVRISGLNPTVPLDNIIVIKTAVSSDMQRLFVYRMTVVMETGESYIVGQDKPQLNFLNDRTFNADTDDDMGQPISETFTAGQTVTGVKAGETDATGTLTADASGTTMTITPSSGVFITGMEVINDTIITGTGPSAAALEFLGSTPFSNPIGTVEVWGDATWEVSTDSAFTAPMVGTKVITPDVNQILLPTERGAIVLATDTSYWARVSYNATDPSLPNVTSSAVHFKTSPTTRTGFPETYYDTATDTVVTGNELVERYGINPTTDNLNRLGVAELTEQPTYPVAGYQAIDDKYQPIEDLTGEVEKLEERNQVLAQYVAADLIAEAQALVAQWAAEDGTDADEEEVSTY